MIENKSFLITGGTGLIGLELIRQLLKNGNSIYVVVRNKVKKIFDDNVNLIQLEDDYAFDFPKLHIDYIVHLASSTHPIEYATDPIGTIESNVIYLRNILKNYTSSLTILFASSVEVYGLSDTIDSFDESHFGQIDCNTLRSGYCEAKRCCESMLCAYAKQNRIKYKIARLARTYGQNACKDDSKAMNQFLRNGLEGKNIQLKSDGELKFSFMHVEDAVDGMLRILEFGKDGEAYNVADELNDCSLKKMAEIIADICNVKVEFTLPDSVEAAGFSKAKNAIMNGNKLKNIGWIPKYDIISGLKDVIEKMRRN